MIRRPAQFLARFASHQRGAIMVLAVFAMAIVAALIISLRNFDDIIGANVNLQPIANAAVVRGAGELSAYIDGTRDAVKAVDDTIKIMWKRAEILQRKLTITDTDVTLQLWTVVKGQIYRASARAKVLTDAELCVVGLSRKGQAVKVGNRSVLGAPDCQVHSNSKASDAIAAYGDIHAAKLCSVGGIGYRDFANGVTNCPPAPDPLAGKFRRHWAPNMGQGRCRDPKAGELSSGPYFAVEAYDRVPAIFTSEVTNQAGFKPTNIGTTEILLNPGHYCAIIGVKNAKIKLAPGNYVINGMGLWMMDNARLSGDNVSIEFQNGASLYLGKSTQISLTGRYSGARAGMLMFENVIRRTNGMPVNLARSLDQFYRQPLTYLLRWHKYPFESRLHHYIASKNVHKLTGTIYFPYRKLQIATHARVAKKSAFTAILTTALHVDEDVYLALNSNYGASPVAQPSQIPHSTVSQIPQNPPTKLDWESKDQVHSWKHPGTWPKTSDLKNCNVPNAGRVITSNYYTQESGYDALKDYYNDNILKKGINTSLRYLAPKFAIWAVVKKIRTASSGMGYIEGFWNFPKGRPNEMHACVKAVIHSATSPKACTLIMAHTLIISDASDRCAKLPNLLNKHKNP